jgi:putative membrane protein
MDKSAISNAVVVFLKGAVMGTANVIPGVSGGTFAIILGILERIVDAIKSFNKRALELLIKRQFKELIKHTDLVFLMQLFAGMIFAIVSLAKLLEFLFAQYPELVWAFFFGLILASVYFVGRRVSKWRVVTVAAFVIGVAIATGTSLLSPAVENPSIPYVFLCGMLAISAMILPGVSGSFLLILLGNYELIVIDGIGNLRFEILIPFAAGCGIGLLAFSYLLSYVLKKFKDVTISTLTGFILGSLLVIWPWKNPVYKLNELGEQLLKDDEPVIFKYQRFIPDSFDGQVVAAIALVLVGIALMWFAERNAHSDESIQGDTDFRP